MKEGYQKKNFILSRNKFINNSLHNNSLIGGGNTNTYIFSQNTVKEFIADIKSQNSKLYPFLGSSFDSVSHSSNESFEGYFKPHENNDGQLLTKTRVVKKEYTFIPDELYRNNMNLNKNDKLSKYLIKSPLPNNSLRFAKSNYNSPKTVKKQNNHHSAYSKNDYYKNSKMIINPFNKTKNQSNYEQIKDSTDKIESGSTWVNFVKGSYTNLNKSNSTNLNRVSSGNISNSSIYTNLAFGIICINN